MIRRTALVARVLLVAGSVGLAACGSRQSPTAPGPDPAGGSIASGTELTAEQASVPLEANASIRGQVSNLSLERGTFLVSPPAGERGPARWVTVDARTVIWTFRGSARTRLRFASLANGLAVDVHGIDGDRYILALNIAVRTRG